MSEKKQAVIASAVRTPMGSFQGVFSSIPATKLGSQAIAEAMKRINLRPDRVDEVYMGCVLSAGLQASVDRRRNSELSRRNHDQQGLRVQPQGRDHGFPGHCAG